MCSVRFSFGQFHRVLRYPLLLLITNAVPGRGYVFAKKCTNFFQCPAFRLWKQEVDAGNVEE